jgi:Domain of unknown function (DUF397)
VSAPFSAEMTPGDSAADPSWRRSTLCGPGGCVEVAPLGKGLVAVRDSKVDEGPVLVYTPDEWIAFVEGVKAGEFDDVAVTPGG